MSGFTLRIRHSDGQGVVKGLEATDSVHKLINDSFTSLGIDMSNSDCLKILSGFPPKPLDISDRDLTLGTLGIRAGDTLIYQMDKKVESKESTGTSEPVQSKEKEDVPKQNGAVFGVNPEFNNKRLKPEGGLIIKRQVVPADNSCLFTSVNFCMCGQVVDSEHTSFMREIIAATVSSDPDNYSEAILGKSSKEYCDWIQTKDAWGGAIELQILAENFQTVIVAVDTKSGCMTKFGESGNYPQMMILIYDGIHYDPLYQESPSRKTLFSASDASVLESVKKFAEGEKQARNYTDTTGFSLKCLVCGHLMKGAAEAQSHAKNTKHTNFSEV